MRISKIVGFSITATSVVVAFGVENQETESVVLEGRSNMMERVIENLLTYATRGESARHTDNVLEQYRQQR